MQMGRTALSLFLLTLTFGHFASYKPLDQLGRRPMGTGLFTYLYHHLMDGVGIWGYDSSLGAWSPPIRLGFHVSCVLSLWALYIRLSSGECVTMLTTAVCGVTVAQLYLVFFYIYFHLMPNVSHPGGPRAHKIQRMPHWDDRTTSSPRIAQSCFCAVDQDSHRATEKRFEGTAGSLSGEPAGRQIWTQGEQTTKNRVDEKLVQDMASGGRPDGFNPSINPNRYYHDSSIVRTLRPTFCAHSKFRFVTSADKVFRAQQIRNYLGSGNKAPSFAKPKSVQEAAHKATHFYSMLQTEDGHWAGDYGGPHFLMPGIIIAWYLMGKPDRMLNQDQVELMKHYITVHQQSDGGWGTHIESPSTMFGTTLMYVAIRLLGVEAEDKICVQGRAFLQQHGGAVMTSSWAKFYLCLLGCMDWNGHNSVPPEMWLLPNWFPFHPGRLWCHCRMVYLPMGYLYGSRFVYDKAETDPTIQSLRKEVSGNYTKIQGR